MGSDEPAKQVKIEQTTGVPRDANWWDKTGFAGIATGGSLAVYIAFVVMPDQIKATKELTTAITSMEKSNDAHYRAMSDDRRVQFDEIRNKLVDAGHNIDEIRRDNERRRGDYPKTAAPANAKPPSP